MPKRPFLADHLCSPPSESGGGIGTRLGRFTSVESAVAAGTLRLLEPVEYRSPHDRILIHRTTPGRPRHPLWLYRDDDGRVCAWSRHPSQPIELWGYASS